MSHSTGSCARHTSFSISRPHAGQQNWRNCTVVDEALGVADERVGGLDGAVGPVAGKLVVGLSSVKIDEFRSKAYMATGEPEMRWIVIPSSSLMFQRLWRITS